MQWLGQAADREDIKRQAANGQSRKNSPGNKQGNTLGETARKCQTGLNKTSP